MNKRSFLKATGVTFVASLFAAPFLGRRDSEANAQEGGDLAAQIEALRKEFREQLQNEIDERNAADAAIKRSLDVSFIGTVTAIASNKIPYGWHLCDGTPIPDASEFKLLKDLTGLTHFPDYRGVFLRGLDEVATDGSEMKPERRDFYKNEKGEIVQRVIGSFESSANLKHSHGAIDGNGNGMTDGGGKHSHGGKTVSAEHSHGDPDNRDDKKYIGGLYKARHTERLHSTPTGYDWDDDPDSSYNEPNIKKIYPITGGAHTHGIPEQADHTHVIKASGIGESRPKNVAVRYIIKYAMLGELEEIED